jgi:hypothetical protein
VLHVIGEAEIARGVGIGSGDDVPAGAAAADMVEGGESARDVIGRVEGGRAGGDEAEVLGHAGERREQRERLVRRHRVATLERVERHVQHRQVIGHEEGVEPAALKRLCEALEMREVEIGVGEGAGIAPGAGMDGGGPHECVQPQLPRCRHG